MKTSYSIDQESFQVFLANAFAVQESGLDPQSLSSLIEIQRFITSEEFDLNRAMHMIAERALGVCRASGVAVGLLEANTNELVYRAGSGSAGNDVGRRVPAVLSASSPRENRREILRVENAETDKRIDAEICRQFGAMALLMVPIYKAHALVGVLQVLFDEPHCFVEREVRTYRLMVSALEDGILRDLDAVEQEPVLDAVQQSQIPAKQLPQPVDTIAAPEILAESDQLNVSAGLLRQNLETSAIPRESSVHDHVVILRRELNALWSAFTKTIASFETRAWNANSRYAGPAIACVLAVTILIMISHLNHRSDASIHSSISTLQDVQQQAPAKPFFVNDQTNGAGDEQKEIISPGLGFKRVRVGPNEVDYVSADVTIRSFETRPSKPQLRKGVKKEIRFGDDVTVRYFGNTSALVSKEPGNVETTPTTKESSFRSQ